MVRSFLCNSPGYACFGLAITLAAPMAYAVSDVLETPARDTDLAPESLLTDATRIDDRIVAVGERGHVIYSDDEGTSWNQADVPVSVTLTALDFGTDQYGWAVGHSGAVLQSSDAGESWQLQLDGMQAGRLIIETKQQQIADMEERIEQAPEEDVPDLEWALDDLYFALENTEADLEVGPVNPFLDVWFENARHGFVVGAYGMIFRTLDGGDSWQDWSPQLDNDWNLHYNAITRIAGGALVIAGESGQIHVSEDNGNTWEKRESPYSGSLFGVSGTGEEGEMLVFGLRGNTLISSDLGQSWETVPNAGNSTLNRGAVAEDGRVTLVGNGGAVLYSNDDGRNFQAHFRSDRDGIMAVVPLAESNLLLFGEGGVETTDARGRNLD